MPRIEGRSKSWTTPASGATSVSHWPEGGLGDAVLGALADVEDVRVHKLAAEIMPGSGKPAELIHKVGIDAETIVTAALELVRAPAR